jgi:hypothetical protein
VEGRVGLGVGLAPRMGDEEDTELGSRSRSRRVLGRNWFDVAVSMCHRGVKRIAAA